MSILKFFKRSENKPTPIYQHQMLINSLMLDFVEAARKVIRSNEKIHTMCGLSSEIESTYRVADDVNQQSYMYRLKGDDRLLFTCSLEEPTASKSFPGLSVTFNAFGGRSVTVGAFKNTKPELTHDDSLDMRHQLIATMDQLNMLYVREIIIDNIMPKIRETVKCNSCVLSTDVYRWDEYGNSYDDYSISSPFRLHVLSSYANSIKTQYISAVKVDTSEFGKDIYINKYDTIDELLNAIELACTELNTSVLKHIDTQDTLLSDNQGVIVVLENEHGFTELLTHKDFRPFVMGDVLTYKCPFNGDQVTINIQKYSSIRMRLMEKVFPNYTNQILIGN